MKKTTDITKATLINAVNKTYDNSLFYVGESTDKTADFRLKISRCRSLMYTKNELLELIHTKSFDVVKHIPELPMNLAISPDYYVCKGAIKENVVFHTMPPNGFNRVTDSYNANHHVYLKLDKELKTISFCLGEKVIVLSLVEHTKFTYKLAGSQLYCCSAINLERFINESPDGKTRMVILGRRALKIKPVV